MSNPQGHSWAIRGWCAGRDGVCGACLDFLVYKGVKRVHYLCHWEGYDTDADTYEPLENIPKQARTMVNEYNASLRAAAQAAAAPAAKRAKHK